jgi:hypothetical protein
LKMEITLPDVLVGLGIAKDVEEGKVFLGTLVLALKGGGGKGVGN